MKITFWGAAQTVTGSMHEIAVNGGRYLFDCGQYQGRRQEAKERNTHFPFPVASIRALMLSHAHIDHSGNLPLLAKQGYQAPIYTSAATADLCVPMLADSAHLQEMDAMFLNKRHQRRRLVDPSSQADEIQPLYSTEDAEKVYPLFRPVPMHTPTEIGPGVSYSTVDAGHMLGSTSIVVEAKDGNRTLRLGYSGDVGRPGLPIIRDPEPLPKIDYLIMESTYGDRLHQELGNVKQKLADVVNRTAGRGGRIIVPAFAVGRTQQLVVVLHQLIDEGKIPSIPVFVDSPLAVNVTEVFRKHENLFDTETQSFLENGEDPFGFKLLRYIRDVNESKALNDLRGPFMVISASGMCEAGRILHHLRHNIEDPRNTILITGFQAENTLGRKIVDKQPEVNIFGEPHRLRAEVAKLNELSGHADQRELLAWMKPAAGTGLKRVFLVHGEPGQQRALAQAIQETHGIEVAIPAHGDSFVLD
jgi:metallo-beta-lactamase family protein